MKLWPAVVRIGFGGAAVAAVFVTSSPAFAEITGFNPSTSTATGTGTFAGNTIQVTRLLNGVDTPPACNTVVVGATWSCTFATPLTPGSWQLVATERAGVEFISTTTLNVVIDPAATLPVTPAGHPLPLLATGASLIAAGALLLHGVRRTERSAVRPL